MSNDDIEKITSSLNEELAELSEQNKWLGEELEKKKKIIEGQKKVFARIKDILDEKAFGFNGVYKVYAEEINNTIMRMLKKEGAIQDDRENE